MSSQAGLWAICSSTAMLTWIGYRFKGLLALEAVYFYEISPKN